MDSERAVRKSGAPGSTPPGPVLEGGRYRVEALLGRGGVGSVYRAYDLSRRVHVALKRLDVRRTRDVQSGARTSAHPVRADASADGDDARRQARLRARLLALFQREYHTLAQLAHPRIIEVYDYGIGSDGPFYTMELLTGQDLSMLAPMPWRRACQVLRDVASALTLLHSRRMLHRDISPRNVHCSIDGVAKLIDFGAMSPHGTAQLLVGTPPFVPPEAVQRQTLDARADLYSLGALGYFLLSGHPPYRARSFEELRDAWRSPPAPPSAYAQDVPEQLDGLVMRLLSMDRSARPNSAVELVERLTGLAGLDDDARLAVPNAYLTTPALVGRQTQLAAVRRRTLRASRVHGRGASLLVSGAPGSGLSRFVDACAIEGKLAGALVLRGRPGAAGGAEHGVTRSLLVQLHAALSDAERRAYDLPAQLQCQLVPGLIWAHGVSKPPSLRPAPISEQRAELQEALQGYLARLAARRPLLILIDDFHAIDAASAAVIAGLAPLTATQRIVIVAAYGSDAPAHAQGPLRTMREYSRALVLEPLSPEEIETLLGSVFGSVPKLAVVAHRLHALCAGKPRVCMELAQHLVDTGVIRYDAGGFVLPEALAAADLPESFEAALRARYARLSKAARRLGAIAALCAGAPLSLEQCLALAQPLDRSAFQRALAELVSTQMFVIEDDHITLRQGAASSLVGELGSDELRQVQDRIGELFALDPTLQLRAAEHLFHAGEDARALELLLAQTNTTRHAYDSISAFSELVETALRACERLGRPRRERYVLRRARLMHALHYLEPMAHEELLSFARELYRMCGLSHWDALSELPQPERLTRALQLASDEYEGTPEALRAWRPEEAIAELATYLAALSGYGCSTFDLDLLEQLPSMAAYTPLSPALEIPEAITRALRDLRASRHEHFLTGLQRIFERLDQPDRAGMEPKSHHVTYVSLLYGIGLTNAALGRPEVFAQADRLEELPSMRSAAWRVRQIAHLYRGDAEQAERCRKRYELLLIQHGTRQGHGGTTLETEFMCYARQEDLVNLRRLLPELSAMASRHRGWQPLFLLAQAELERIRGRLEPARVLYERMLEITLPGRHMMWPYATAFHIHVLVDLGRAAEGKQRGFAALALCDQYEMGLLRHNIAAALVDAEAALGEIDSAIARADGLIDNLERNGVGGLLAGIRYEQRARLSLLARDAEGFARHFERCRAHYGAAENSPFTQNLARLLADARAAKLDDAVAAVGDEDLLVRGAIQRLRRELAVCADVEERAERALALVLQSTHADAGHLFVIQNDRLLSLASSAGGAADDALRGALESLVARAAGGEHDNTVIMDCEVGAVTQAAVRDGDGLTYQPHIVADEHDRPVAVLALRLGPGVGRAPARELLSALAEELLARDDMSMFTVGS